MRPLSGHEEIIAPEAIFLRRLKYDERQTVKRRLAGDTARAATTGEVQDLRRVWSRRSRCRRARN